MKKYDLIALDMDGTAVTDDKQMRESTIGAIRAALRAGKEVVFCTGRGIAEMQPFLDLFPEMHYMVGESGALVYDIQKKKVLSKRFISQKDAEILRQASVGRDVMPLAFREGNLLMNRSQANCLTDYQMEPYAKTMPPIAELHEDLFREIAEGVFGPEKFIILHKSPQEREKTIAFLEKMEPEVEMVCAEISSLELSPAGVTKAVGLEDISRLAGIAPERMIMVGDAENDLAALKYAGLSVAMGNADESVKRFCDVIVDDNNHDGCAEAIRRYLLEEDVPVPFRMIARIHTDFPEKFGIPRQSGLIPQLKGQIVFEPEFRDANALKGLEEYSHIWLIWMFSETNREKWSPTVRPPRLGGDTRMGVFATRSPFRPNPVGLSCVKLDGIREVPGKGMVLEVSGADLMDGTPVFDIKPYLPFTDSHPEALAGFTTRGQMDPLEIDIPEEYLSCIPDEKHAALLEVLRLDPRPRYQDDPERVYGLSFAGFNIRFRVKDGMLTVCGVQKQECS